jgi:hypothetical protein
MCGKGDVLHKCIYSKIVKFLFGHLNGMAGL